MTGNSADSGDTGDRDLELDEIIDVPAIQSLMENFCQLVPIPMAVIDRHGKVLVGVGWQDICTRFHRVHPESCKNCIESDTQLSAGVPPGEFKLYKCKNNLWDVATPIIVDGRHVGNVFSGQFFLEGEPVEYERFRSQARRYGFNEEAYLAALDRVPRLTTGLLDAAMAFFIKLAHMLSQLSYSNVALARSSAQRDVLLSSLGEREADLRRAQSVADTGSWRMDVRRNELRWSDHTYQMFGISPQTPLTYEAFLDAVHPDDREAVDRAWQAALRSGHYDIDHRIVVGDRVKWVRECAELEFDSGGGLLGGFGTVQDITERKRLEQQLRQQADQLAEANRLKDEFLATLSHELRTPVNNILGWSRLLGDARLDAETARRALESIHRNAQMQTQLVADILDVSRIITGKLRLNLRELDLVSVVLNAIDAVRPAADAKRIQLHQVMPWTPALVTGDATRMQQILWNLLSNAVKFTPSGGQVHVELQRHDSQWKVTVQDTGIGINGEFLPFVFERFRQGDGSTCRQHGGLGLGLAIVRHLAELHGGTVAAKSEGTGKGATFTVSLPVRALYSLAGEARTGTDHEPTSPTRPDLTGLRVLLVDDDADARELVATLLSGLGAEVVKVASASEALQEIVTTKPDLLLADIAMPGEDGYELMRKVRLLPSHQGGAIAAAALTAHGSAEDRNRAFEAGYQLHIPKPVLPDDLAVTVASLARKSTWSRGRNIAG
jgi:PAS domain S-box-containing protein